MKNLLSCFIKHPIPRVLTAAACGLILGLGPRTALCEDTCTQVEEHLRQGDNALAEQSARSCLTQFPNHVRMWYLLSRALAGQKEYLEAIQWVDKAIEKYPGDKDLHIWRIRLLAWSGDLEKAWSERYRIMKTARYSHEAAMLIADVAYWRKDCEQAVKWYDYIAKKWPNSERAKANRDRCTTDGAVLGSSPPPPASPASPTVAAASAATTAATTTPKAPARTETVAKKAPAPAPASTPRDGLSSGGSSQSSTVAAAPVQPSSESPSLAASSSATDSSAGASATVSVVPGSCAGLDALLQRRTYLAAEMQARECLKSRRNSTQAYEVLFSALLARGRARVVFDEATALLIRRPSSQFFKFWRFQALVAQGRLQKAWNESAAIAPYEQQNYLCGEAVAKLAFQLGKYHLAVDKYRAFLRKWPESRWARFNLARAYARTSRPAEAAAELNTLCLREAFEPACQEMQAFGRPGSAMAMAPVGEPALANPAAATYLAPSTAPSGPVPALPVASPVSVGTMVPTSALPLLIHKPERWSFGRARVMERAARNRIQRRLNDKGAWLLLLRALEAQGRHDEGLALLETAVLKGASQAETDLWKMRFLSHLKKWDDAWKFRESLRPILQSDPAASRIIGDIAYARGDQAEALRYYSFYLMLWPRSADVHYMRSLTHKGLSDAEKASADMQRACLIGGYNHVACRTGEQWAHDMGTTQAQQFAQSGQYPQAMRAVSRVIEQQPRDIQARLLRVRLLAYQGQLDQALSELMQLYKHNGKDREVTRLFADLAYWRREYATAVERYSLYDVLWPDDSEALLNRGRSYVELGELGAASRDFAAVCRRVGPSSPACRYQSQAGAGTLARTGLHSSPANPTLGPNGAPVAAYAGGATTAPSGGTYLFPGDENLNGGTRLAAYRSPSTPGQNAAAEASWADQPLTGECSDYELLLKNQKYREAELLLETCLKQPTTSSRAEYMAAMSRALAGQQKFDSALEWADRALQQEPQNRPYALWRARLRAWSNDHDRAFTEAKSLHLADPDDREAALLVADVAFFKKDFPLAINLYSRYLNRWGRDPQARLNRGRSYLEIGETDLGKTDLTVVCNEEGPSSPACNDLDSSAFSQRIYTLMVQAGYSPVHDEGLLSVNDSWQLMGLFSMSFGRKLRIGTSGLLQGRQFLVPSTQSSTLTGTVESDDFEYDYDFFWDVFASYRWQVGVELTGAVGFTIDQDFLPVVSVKLQPAYHFDFGLSLSMLLWRLQWETGATVLSPGISYAVGAWFFHLQGFLGIADDGSAGGAALGKVTFNPIPLLGLSLGLGVGDTPEYLQSSEVITNYDPFIFWSLMAGLHINIKEQHSLLFDYIYRDEIARGKLQFQNAPNFMSSQDAPDIHYRQHTILVGYRATF